MALDACLAIVCGYLIEYLISININVFRCRAAEDEQHLHGMAFDDVTPHVRVWDDGSEAALPYWQYKYAEAPAVGEEKVTLRVNSRLCASRADLALAVGPRPTRLRVGEGRQPQCRCRPTTGAS